MGVSVECPNCGHEFYVHGHELETKCFECGRKFNPQYNIVR